MLCPGACQSPDIAIEVILSFPAFACMDKRWLWWLVFAALMFLSIDFWDWNDDSILLFMPLWAWYIFSLTLAISAFFALFSKYGWRDE